MEDAEVRWIDCNIGSRLTMKYPGVVMKGRRARGEVIPSPSPTTASTRTPAPR
jgi:Fe-S cluster assembly scaffold protein SufB